MTATERAKLIDEAGLLEEKLAPYAGDRKRLEALRTEFRKWADDDKIEPLDTVPYSGAKFQVTLGRKELKRSVKSMAAVFKTLGKKKFLEVASVTLKALEEALGAAAAGFLRQDHTGARDVTIVRLPAK